MFTKVEHYRIISLSFPRSIHLCISLSFSLSIPLSAATSWHCFQRERNCLPRRSALPPTLSSRSARPPCLVDLTYLYLSLSPLWTCIYIMFLPSSYIGVSIKSEFSAQLVSLLFFVEKDDRTI